MSINLLSRIHDLWKRFVTSKYVRALEAELARLRSENRALMNSILGIAGIPPIITQESDSAQKVTSGGKGSAESKGVALEGAQAAVPVRRRSWQQVNRALEIEAAKKEPGKNGS